MRLSNDIFMQEEAIKISDIFDINELSTIREFDFGNPLQVSDFDDTIYSRKIPLSKKGIKNNRGINGYYYIIAHYSGIIDINYNSKVTDEIKQKVDKLAENKRLEAIKGYVKEYYGENNGEDILGPVGNINELIDKTGGISNVIITAGIKELQELKVQFSGISEVPKVIVDKGEEKIKALINYIVNNLCYIPREIIVNEDRPEFFIKYGKILAEVLGAKIVVNTIKINEEKNIAETITTDTFYPKIKEAAE